VGVESFSTSEGPGAIRETYGRVRYCAQYPPGVDLFERIFLLRIDAQTQERRLRAYDGANRQVVTKRADSRSERAARIFEAQMLELGAIPLDGTAPTATLADQLVAVVCGAR
jgi:hypothetical protein